MEGRPPDEDDDLPRDPAYGADPLDPGDDPAAAAAGVRGLFPDAVKKALLAGVGALFMTEEGARKLAREWRLPKEIVGFVGQQAAGAKDEILRVLSDEIRRFLESEAVRREFWKALSAMAVEVKAEIRLVPSEDGRPRPEVKAEVRPKRARAPRKPRTRK